MHKPSSFLFFHKAVNILKAPLHIHIPVIPIYEKHLLHCRSESKQVKSPVPQHKISYSFILLHLVPSTVRHV